MLNYIWQVEDDSKLGLPVNLPFSAQSWIQVDPIYLF
jgi:hypothetical protein